jgi:hypothetical protein
VRVVDVLYPLMKIVMLMPPAVFCMLYCDTAT